MTNNFVQFVVVLVSVALSGCNASPSTTATTCDNPHSLSLSPERPVDYRQNFEYCVRGWSEDLYKTTDDARLVAGYIVNDACEIAGRKYAQIHLENSNNTKIEMMEVDAFRETLVDKTAFYIIQRRGGFCPLT